MGHSIAVQLLTVVWKTLSRANFAGGRRMSDRPIRVSGHVTFTEAQSPSAVTVTVSDSWERGIAVSLCWVTFLHQV